jgi:CheY-like chemotaxis protein
VDFCIHGKEAYEMIKFHAGKGSRHKIIFTDFSMPIMDGIKATKKIRKFLKNQKLE